jgi:hypothetical protein
VRRRCGEFIISITDAGESVVGVVYLTGVLTVSGLFAPIFAGVAGLVGRKTAAQKIV